MRAWLRHALMHKYLADYFRAITERGDSFLACAQLLIELLNLDTMELHQDSNSTLYELFHCRRSPHSSEFYVDGAALRDEETAALVAGQLLALHVLDYQFCVRPTPPAPASSPDKRPSSALCTPAHPFDAPVSFAVSSSFYAYSSLCCAVRLLGVPFCFVFMQIAEIDFASFLNEEQRANRCISYSEFIRLFIIFVEYNSFNWHLIKRAYSAPNRLGFFMSYLLWEITFSL